MLNTLYNQSSAGRSAIACMRSNMKKIEPTQHYSPRNETPDSVVTPIICIIHVSRSRTQMRLHSFTPKMSTQDTLDTFEEDNDFLLKKKKKEVKRI